MILEFANLRANVLACPRGLHANVLACQRAKSVATSYFYVPTCHKTCQFFKLANQRTKRRANFSTWCANVSKSVPVFQTFLLWHSKGNFYTLSFYKNIYIILDIILMHRCVCVLHKHCIILHFCTSCHLKEKYVEFLLFVTFLLFR